MYRIRRKGRGIAVPLGIVVLHLAIAAMAFQPAPHPGGDNAVYLSVAQSILDGQYRDIFDPASPRHVVYPPGFPLVIAAALAAGVGSWIGLKVITILFSGALVFLTWVYARAEGRRIALASSLAVAISAGVIGLSHWELSDVPFAAFTIAALFAWQRVERNDSGVVVAALLTLAAYSIRSAGLPLMVAAFLWLASRKRWRDVAIMSAIFVPPAAAWWAFARGQTGYFGQLLVADAYRGGQPRIGIGGLGARIVDNVVVYAERFLPVLVAGRESQWVLAVTMPLLLLAVIEWGVRIGSRDRSVREFFAPLYLGMVLLWLPQFAGERLLLPLYPVLILYAALAVRRLAGVLPRRVGNTVVVAASAAFVMAAIPGEMAQVGYGIQCAAQYRNGEPWPCVSEGWRDFYTISELAGHTIPDDGVVLSRKPAVLFALSGNKGRLYPFDRDPRVLIDSARAAGAGYVVLDYVDEIGSAYVVPAIVRRSRAFCIVHALGPNRAALFGILPAADTISDTRADPGKAEVEEPFRKCGPEYWSEGSFVADGSR